MEREKLEEIIGSGAMREYDDTKELRGETGSAVLDAAIANSRSMWWDASWVLSSACSYEAKRRHLAAGHAEDCHGYDIYQLGWNDAYRSQGYTPGPLNPCTCGKEA